VYYLRVYKPVRTPPQKPRPDPPCGRQTPPVKSPRQISCNVLPCAACLQSGVGPGLPFPFCLILHVLDFTRPPPPPPAHMPDKPVTPQLSPHCLLFLNFRREYHRLSPPSTNFCLDATPQKCGPRRGLVPGHFHLAPHGLLCSPDGERSSPMLGFSNSGTNFPPPPPRPRSTGLSSSFRTPSFFSR